ncbi:MAG: glycosyltransferase family 39 protein [Chlamydiota bacterium]
MAGFILAFLIIGIATLSDYGLTWDEALGNIYYGEHYLFYFLTFDSKYLHFDRGIERHPPGLELCPPQYRPGPHEFPPLADTLSAATMNIFSYSMQWLDPVDGFHLFKVLISAVFLWVLYRFIGPRLGKSTAVMSVLFMGTFPRFWGDMHFNPKDIPEMIAIALMIFAYLVWYTTRRLTWAIAAGLLGGASLSIKANVLFIPCVLMVGVWRWWDRPRRWFSPGRSASRFVMDHLVMVLSAALFFVCSWPFLYSHPARGIRAHLGVIVSQGGRHFDWRSGFSWAPPLHAVATMPELMLLFLCVGMVYITKDLRTGDDPLRRVLPVWLLMPIARISLPGMVNFDGIRHFMEYVPAAAIIAGYGAASLAGCVAGAGRRLFVPAQAAIVALLCVNIGWIAVVYHPYEHLYYNTLIGGLGGARRVFGADEATDYWAVSYRRAARWLNATAPADAILHVPVAPHVVEGFAGLWLRPDIRLADADTARDALAAGGEVYCMFITRPAFYDACARYCVGNLAPVYRIVVNGVPIVYIFRMHDRTCSYE